MTQQEIPLIGGNTSTVVRVGDTVRRNVGPWTPAVHALLRHLEYIGFTGAPRVLGLDERGREVAWKWMVTISCSVIFWNRPAVLRSPRTKKRARRREARRRRWLQPAPRSRSKLE